MLLIATAPTIDALLATTAANDYEPAAVRRYVYRRILSGAIAALPLDIDGAALAQTDAETLALLHDLLPAALADHDGSAVAAVVAAGLHNGTIELVTH